MKKKKIQARDGVPYILDLNKNIYEVCCDCGMVHKTKYRILNEKKIEIISFHEKARTGQHRRAGYCNLMKPGGVRGYKIKKIEPSNIRKTKRKES